MNPYRIAFQSAALCALLTMGSLRGADAGFYGVIKLEKFAQSPGGSPAALANNAYSFQAFVVATTNFAVTNATVKSSNTTPLRTLTLDSNGLALRYEESFNTQAALDAAYPTGSGLSLPRYTNTMDTVHDGRQSGVVAFFLGIFPLGFFVSYPTTPAVSNLVEAQAIDTTRDFLLHWNSVGNDLTIVQLLVLDGASNAVFTSPAPFQPGALTGHSNSIVIPAHTLPAGTNLEGHLAAANPGLPNTNAYPGAIGVAALARDVAFPLVTRAAPARPVLTILPAAAGQFQLQSSGESNRWYQIEATTNFLGWTNLLATNSISGVFNFRDPQSTNEPRRFYRARVGQ